jgi:hypothetical protein
MPLLKPQQVSDAIARGVNAKISDGHNLYLIVKNGRGFWVHQFRDGPVIRSKGFGSAANVTLAAARRAREAFSVARRAGIAMPGIRSSVPRGDAFGKAAATSTSQTTRTNGANATARGLLVYCGLTARRSPACQ